MDESEPRSTVDAAIGDDDEPSSIAAWLTRDRPSNALTTILEDHVVIRELDGTEHQLRDLILTDARPFVSDLFPRYEDFVPVYFQPPKMQRMFVPSGPDKLTPDQRRHYKYVWVDASPSGRASTDVRAGNFWASEYSTNGHLQAFAGLGVQLVPTSQWCRLSIRPYVRFEGSRNFSGRTFDIPGGPATASSSGSIGIFVESWATGGGAHHIDDDAHITVSDQSTTNPGRGFQRDFDGTLSSADGLTVTVFATRTRRYRIWVYCWAEAVGQSLQQATAYAGSRISCWMPYLVVEERPA